MVKPIKLRHPSLPAAGRLGVTETACPWDAVFTFILYHIDSICQAQNKSCGYLGLERKKISTGLSFVRNV